MGRPRRKRYRLGWRALARVCSERHEPKAYWVALARDLAFAMVRNRIVTRRRALMFIAQLAHESGQFRFTEEIASGAAYEWRFDLGNTQPGDGRRFKGRAFMQITGRDNYRELPHWDGIDFEKHPQRLSERKYAALAAAWWWRTHGCNELADSRAPFAFLRVTRRINGGTNGYFDRRKHYSRARRKANRDMLIPKRRSRP